MRSHWGIFLILFYFQFIFTPLAARAEYKYFQSESRFPYEVKLLRTALRKAGDNAALKEHPLENYARGMRLLEEGVVDVGFFAATPDLEKRFAPIKQDILNGLLGYRLNLIHKDNPDLFKNVKTLKDLKKLKAGFNEHWPDKFVLIHNKIPTELSAGYENLFVMLNKKRFDYFPRGINEVWTEQERFEKEAPNLIVDTHIAFFYPYPVYFFVRKDNAALAKKIEQGLKIMLKDGSLKASFLEYHKVFLDKAEISKRRVFHLSNPNLPSEYLSQDLDTSWWQVK